MADEMETISTPSYNPTDLKSFEGFYNFLKERIFLELEKVAPARILNYDRKKNRAQVELLNLGITSTGSTIPKQSLTNIPCLMLQGGGMVLSFPIKEGDIGWIVAADRDISVFKQVLSIFAPNTYRKHKYADGFFIPNKIDGFEVSEDDENAILMTSIDGKTKLSISPEGITLTAQTTNVKGDLTSDGTITGAKLVSQNGVSGTFINSVTVENGIVTGGS